MDKENGERDKSTPSDANHLVDPLSMFAGHSMFGGGLGGYGHHLTSAYNALLTGGRAGQYSASPLPPTTSSYGSLGTLSVAASQAASLGINPANAAWWSMASQLAAQDYLARLQASGIQFPSMPVDMSGFPLMSPQQHSQGGSSSKQSHGKSSSTHSSHLNSSLGSSHHRERDSSANPHNKNPNLEGLGRMKSSSISSSKSMMSHPGLPNAMLNDPGSGSLLGGVRLPPDTEIIKYTSSIVGPKVPGTTNRGRKKTISLDPPSVSMVPQLSSNTSVSPSHLRKQTHKPVEDRPTNLTVSTLSPRPISLEAEHSELSELMKLSNGQLTPQASPVPGGYHTPPARALTPASATSTAADCDAPLNLSLKPAPPSPASNNALQSLSSLSQSLGHMPDRISRRKPGPKPRRVSQSPLPPPGPAPSASLAQLFAAADAPRPSPSVVPSSDDDSMSLSHHKDGRPRNLGRGVSKPKKNTVASLLAQSRALGLKSGLDITSPLNHQVNLLKANILQQQMAAREGDSENEDKMGTSSSPGNLVEEMAERSKKLLQQRGLEEMRALVQESQSETSSVPDMSTDTNSSDSDSDKESSVSGKKREGDQLSDSVPPKKRKTATEEETIEGDMRVPLQKGWRRETLVRGLGKNYSIKGDVTYFSPDGHVFKQFPEVNEYLEKNKITELGQHNFSFSPKVLVGDFVHNIFDGNTQRVSGREMSDILEKMKTGLKLIEKFRLQSLQAMNPKPEKERAKDTKKTESAKSKELTRILKDEERSAKQEALKKEREQRSIQALEARRKRQEEAGKLKHEEQLRKLQEREIKRQKTALLKEQIYMQELTKQRELLYTVELERERRRQHMAMVKSLEQRRRQEERERKRLEQKAEKMASREKRLEQRRIDMDLLEEIRKPIEDMELPDLKPLPDLKRIPGVKLSGIAFADMLMVFEFLHTFGETLGFDMGSLPTLNSLQNALLGEEEAEEELLSVMTHMVICAIEDPGIPNPARHTTLLGQSLKQADITHANLSEILRIYLYANATGEVKALAGVQFEREREKRMSDHHNNMGEGQGDDTEGGKNAAFFVALRENSTWKMSELLKHKPFLALNPTQKAKILEFLCHELLQNKAVMRQIENAIEAVAQLKRDRYTNESKLRKLRHLHNRKVRQMALGVVGGRLEGDDDPPPPPPKDDDEDGEGDSGNESDGTQPEEEEDKKLSIEEMARKLEKLNKQTEQTLLSLAESEGQLRCVCFGQDRYYRRYWKFPTAGGLLVEGMESAEPDLFNEFLQRDDADSLETPDIKSEYEAEHRELKPLDDTGDDDDDEMPHLTPEVDTETLLSKYKQEINDNIDDEPAELPLIKPNKEENEKNGSLKEMEMEDNAMKNEFSGGEEDSETKSVSDDKKSQTFQLFQEKGEEDSSITNGQADSDPAWFNVVPREPCDNTSITATTSAFRCGIENSELRIPVFPPPPASPSPSQCDSPSPAPLALTAEESVQLEHCKIYGLPTLAPAKPVPYDLRCGWWRVSDPTELQQLVENLHTRGAREKDLRRNILRPSLGQSWSNTFKKCVAKGLPSTELAVSGSGLVNKPPPPDGQDDWNFSVALRVDMAVLEQVEAMEDKVANASMQVKGWKVPPKANSEEGIQFQPSCSHPPHNLNPIHIAKNRLIDLESYIERRYLKPPLGLNMSGVDVSLNVTADLDTVPKGLIVWREAVSKSQTAAQLSMGLHMLEASIAWDKSIMKANCQFCHSGDNEDKLLLCDGCDKGYHTYCFKPKMDNIPEGDWFCYECMNKATGDKNCIVCGKKLGRNLIVCDNCPKAYHTDCLQPPLSKLPRGKWHCPTCMAKLPRKRMNAKRTISASFNSTSPCSSASRDDSVTNPEPVPSPMPLEELAPESPPPQPVAKKEKGSGKKMTKELAPCKMLLEELETHDEAWPFLLPVNTKQFPTYKKIIKNPMDLGTIRKRLQDSVYKSREEFAADVRLIFNNCETFNEDDSPVGKAGHHMRFFFESRYCELFQKPPS